MAFQEIQLGGALPWGPNPAHDLVPTHDIDEEEREMQARNLALAKKMGVVHKKQSVESWHSSEHDVDTKGLGDLWYAAREGNVARMEYLIEVEKVNVNRTRWSGITPMHRAAEEGQVAAIECLLKHGAAIDPRTTWGWYTPLHLACGRGKLEAGLLLLDSGAKWEATDKAGKAPIEWAINRGYPIIARRLDARFMAMEAAKKKDNHEDLMRKQAEAAKQREVNEKERRENNGKVVRSPSPNDGGARGGSGGGDGAGGRKRMTITRVKKVHIDGKKK